MADAQRDLGPNLPPRGAVERTARELLVLAQRAVEFSRSGPTADLGAAVRQLDRARALLGPFGNAQDERDDG